MKDGSPILVSFLSGEENFNDLIVSFVERSLVLIRDVLDCTWGGCAQCRAKI